MSTVPLLQNFVSSRGTSKNRVLLFVDALRLNHIAMMSRFNEVYGLVGGLECDEAIKIIEVGEKIMKENGEMIERFVDFGNRCGMEYDVISKYEVKIGEGMIRMNRTIAALRKVVTNDVVENFEQDYYRCMIDSNDKVVQGEMKVSDEVKKIVEEGDELMKGFFMHLEFVIDEINVIIEKMKGFVEYYGEIKEVTNNESNLKGLFVLIGSISFVIVCAMGLKMMS